MGLHYEKDGRMWAWKHDRDDRVFFTDHDGNGIFVQDKDGNINRIAETHQFSLRNTKNPCGKIKMLMERYDPEHGPNRDAFADDGGERKRRFL